MITRLSLSEVHSGLAQKSRAGARSETQLLNNLPNQPSPIEPSPLTAKLTTTHSPTMSAAPPPTDSAADKGKAKATDDQSAPSPSPSPSPSAGVRPVPKATGIIVIGMAGSGKTTFMQRVNAYLHEQQMPPYVLNLDPAVTHLPFTANIDIRDTVDYQEVMKQ